VAGLRLLLLATAEFSAATLSALSKGPDDVLGVVTRPDRPAGRGRRLRAPPMKLAAQELGLPVFQPQRVSSPAGLELLRSLAPGVLFVVAFGEVLSEAVLAVPRLGAINLHASLLPRYRGAAPIQRALLAGETMTGVSVQWMVKELDAGDILLQRALSVGEEEDFGSLHDRLAQLGADAAVEAVALLRRGEAPRQRQDSEQASYAPPIRREELVVDWRRPANEIARQVRAFSPRPGARTSRGGKLLKLLAVREVGMEGQERGMPGRVTELTGEGFWVGAGEGRLLILRVQPEGGRVLSGGEYAQGYRLEQGEVLGTV
jgi:methionyl-tRNA formyltransferase